MKLPGIFITILIALIINQIDTIGASNFAEFKDALIKGETETAALVLHELLKPDPYSSQIWKQAADICFERNMTTQTLVFLKAALNLEKNINSQNQLKSRIDILKENCCTDIKLEYVVTFANTSVKLLKNLLNLPAPSELEPLKNGERQLPGLVIKSEKELEALGVTENPEKSIKLKTKKSNKISDRRDVEEDIIDNTVPVEKMPSYNQSELMKNIIYPEDAIIKMKQGKVVVKVFINSKGEPLKPEIKSSTNKIFNKSAMDAVLKTSYEPARQNGQPVGCWMIINIDFVLKH
jgi:TonB family protein